MVTASFPGNICSAKQTPCPTVITLKVFKLHQLTALKAGMTQTSTLDQKTDKQCLHRRLQWFTNVTGKKTINEKLRESASIKIILHLISEPMLSRQSISGTSSPLPSRLLFTNYMQSPEPQSKQTDQKSKLHSMTIPLTFVCWLMQLMLEPPKKVTSVSRYLWALCLKADQWLQNKEPSKFLACFSLNK